MERLQVEHDMEEDVSDDDKNEDMEAVDALEQYWIYTKSFIANQEPVKAERLHTIFRWSNFVFDSSLISNIVLHKLIIVELAICIRF